MEVKKPVDVVCAVIERDGKVLICQRSVLMEMPGKWEFPGGKIEKDETPIQALVREIRAGLDMYIHIKHNLTPIDWTYPSTGQTIHIIPYFCNVSFNSEPFLAEHAGYSWVEIKDMIDIDWADADIPIVQEVVTMMD